MRQEIDLFLPGRGRYACRLVRDHQANAQLRDMSAPPSPSSKPRHCVIGSGPAAVSCAHALVHAGCEVQMLDAGLQLEPERASVVELLARHPREQWKPEWLQVVKEGMNPGAKGIPEKRLFGSDYPYRDVDQQLAIQGEGIGLRASFALGGLSTVWGSAMLPYLEEDTAEWPVSMSALRPHYNAVLKFARISGELDGMNELFPFLEGPFGKLEASRQATAMLNKLERHRESLAGRGIRFGRARVAIQATGNGTAGCNYCGFCMYGCPYGYIYKSGDTVEELKRHPNFTYQPDVVVTAVKESRDDVIVSGHHRMTREPLEFRAGRVYLGAGVIPTTRILLRSLSAFEQRVPMLDSQYFLLPALLTKRVTGVRREALHGLSQIFVEIIDKEISPHAVHLQVYSYNDLIGGAVRNMMGPLAKPFDFMARELEGRLMLFQGFVHSKHSGRIWAALRKSADGETLELKGAPNPDARRVIGKVTRKLLKNAGKTGVIPLPMMLQVAEPGRSFHVGGSFPMSQRPGRLETDLLGRPAGWSRVHAIDATVFPSVPATTITFSAMANAHRIGTAAAALD
jgi:ferredoxin